MTNNSLNFKIPDYQGLNFSLGIPRAGKSDDSLNRILSAMPNFLGGFFSTGKSASEDFMTGISMIGSLLFSFLR